MGFFATLSSLNPFSREPEAPTSNALPPAELTLDAAAQEAERQLLAIQPPIDVEKTPRRPGYYEEPRQLPYIGGVMRPQQCMTAWTVQRARSALDALDAGNFSEAALMMEEMLRDDAVYHGYSTRSGRLFGLPQRILGAVNEEGAPRRGSMRARKLWQKYQKLIFPQGCKREIMKYLYFFRFAICSITWLNVPNTDEANGPAYWRIPQFKVWHPFWLRFIFDSDPDRDGGIGGEQASGHYQVTTYNEGTIDLINENAPGKGRWVLFQGAGMRPWFDALIRPLASPWLRRLYTRRDHGRFEEKHGLPITMVKFPTYFGSESREWIMFENSLRTLGSEGVLMCPQDKDNPKAGVSVEFAGPPNAAALNTFVESKKEEDQDIYTLWLGQSLTTEAGQNGGSHAALLGMLRGIDDLARGDSFWISDAEVEWYATKDGETTWHTIPADGPIREQIGKFFAWYNFGDPDLAPYDMIDGTPKGDRKEAAEIAKSMNQAHHYKALALMEMCGGIEKLNTMGLKPNVAFMLEQIGLQFDKIDDEENATPGLSSMRQELPRFAFTRRAVTLRLSS
jgi:hypothetical protein